MDSGTFQNAGLVPPFFLFPAPCRTRMKTRGQTLIWIWKLAKSLTDVRQFARWQIFDEFLSSFFASYGVRIYADFCSFFFVSNGVRG